MQYDGTHKMISCNNLSIYDNEATDGVYLSIVQR